MDTKNSRDIKDKVESRIQALTRDRQKRLADEKKREEDKKRRQSLQLRQAPESSDEGEGDENLDASAFTERQPPLEAVDDEPEPAVMDPALFQAPWQVVDDDAQKALLVCLVYKCMLKGAKGTHPIAGHKAGLVCREIPCAALPSTPATCLPTAAY